MFTPSDLGLHFPSYRTRQLETAMEIVNYYNSGARFVLLKAPPGAGKSAINMTVQRLLNEQTLYLVPTKALGGQIDKDFRSHLTQIHGHNSYGCADVSHMGDFECRAGARCEYRKIRDKIDKEKANVLTNYHHQFAITSWSNSQPLGDFGLAIADEGHNLSQILSDLLMVNLNLNQIRNIESLTDNIPEADSANYEEWQSWAQLGLDQIKNDDGLKMNPRLKAEIKETLTKITQIDNTWVIFAGTNQSQKTYGSSQASGRQITLHPVWPRKYKHRIFGNIPRVLISSATIEDSFPMKMGLKKSETVWVRLPSEFAANRRPFVLFPVCEVDFRTTSSQWNRIAECCAVIADSREGLRIVIHSVSFDRGELIYHRMKERLKGEAGKGSSRDSRLILHHRGQKVEALLEQYKATPGAILISPSLQEGHDLPGDLLRCNVILKVPKLDRRDPITRARLRLDKEYVDEKSMIDLEQTYGRGMRFKKDWGETIVLDGHLLGLLKKKQFDKYIKDAFILKGGRDIRELARNYVPEGLRQG